MTVGTGCVFAGQRLMDSNIRKIYGVNIVGIQRAAQYIPIPDGRTRVYPGDVISVIGTDEQIEKMLPDVEKNLPESDTPVTPDNVKLMGILLDSTSPLISKTPRSAALRDTYEALVVAVERGDEHIDSNPDLVFQPGDILWVVADPEKVKYMKQA